MEKINLYLQDANIDLQKDFIDTYLKEVDEKLKDNPMFIRHLYSAIALLTRKGAMNNHIPPIELSISEDGRSFQLIGGVRPNPDCYNENLKNNKNFESVSFNLGENDELHITESSGTLYKFDDFMKAHEGSEYGKKFQIFNSQGTPTIISVYHKNTIISSDGIEVAKSTYSDEYPLGITMDMERELKAQTFIHAPRKWYFNLRPDEAPFEFDPIKNNAHRYLERLGIVTYQESVGKNGVVEVRDYVSSTEYPEVLAANPTVLKKYERGKESITPEFIELFPGKNEKEIYKEIELSFASGVEGSKTKDINPRAYEAVKEQVQKGLEKKYGISPEEPEETHGLGM